MVTFLVAVLGLLVVGLLGAAVLVVFFVRRERARRRPVIRIRHVLGPAFLVATLVMVGVTPMGASTFDLTFQFSAGGGSGADEFALGRSVTETVDVPLETVPATTYVVRGRGVTVDSWQREGSVMRVVVTHPAVAEPGTYHASLRLTPYVATLPPAQLEALHDRSPIATAVVVAAVPLLPLYLLAWILLDGDRPLARPRSRWIRRRLGE